MTLPILLQYSSTTSIQINSILILKQTPKKSTFPLHSLLAPSQQSFLSPSENGNLKYVYLKQLSQSKTIATLAQLTLFKHSFNFNKLSTTLKYLFINIGLQEEITLSLITECNKPCICYFSQSALYISQMTEETIFDKILRKEIPSTPVYEDQEVYAFKDIYPAAPVHILIIPKVRDGLTGLSQAEDRHEKILGRLLVVANKIAKQEKLEGFRIVINDGKHAGQMVFHLHVHLLAGGKPFTWPPGTSL